MNEQQPADAEKEKLNCCLEELEKDNFALSQELSNAYETIDMLYQMSDLLGQRLDLRSLYNMVLQMILERLESQMGVLFHYQETSSSLLASAVQGVQPEEVLVVEIGEEESMLKYAIENKQTLIVNDFMEDKRLNSLIFPSLGIHRAICSPLLVSNEVVGVLVVGNPPEGEIYTSPQSKLLNSLAVQTANFIENIRLREEEEKKQKIEEQIQIAKSIQLQLLPTEAPVLSGISLAGRSLPARDIGGDYFDFVKLSENQVAIVVGDVAGKGIPAGLLMAMIKGVFRAYAKHGIPPSKVLAEMNRVMVDQNIDDRFVTIMYIIYDCLTQKITVSNAGHEPLLIFRKATGKVEQLSGECLPVGIIDEENYQNQEVSLHIGDVVVVFTDGFSEAMNPGMTQFKIQGIEAILQQYADHEATGIIEALYQAVWEHVQTGAQYDDMTVVVLKVEGESQPSEKTTTEK